MPAHAQSKPLQRQSLNRAAEAQHIHAKSKPARKPSSATPAYLQAKLNVSQPDDPHEREADQVADNVMRMPAQPQRQAETAERQIQRASLKPGITPIKRALSRLISRDSLKPGEEPIQRASLKPGDEALQRKGETETETETEVQSETESAESSTPSANPAVENRIDAKRGRGERLPEGLRGDMESRFGRDFSAVRIHTDKEAAEISGDIEARAFTVGNDIFFADAQFDPQSAQGKRLLAHELTHVAQQQQAAESEQAETQPVSRSEQQAQRWFLTDWLANQAWKILKRVAPSGLYTLVREVWKKGIFGYLKEKISDAVSAVFNGLKQGADVLSGFFAGFTAMAKSAQTIIKALLTGDCKPLFAAVKQLKEMISQTAGEAWKAIKEFFQPIGDFFSDLWKSWGAPVLDWLKKAAGNLWKWLKDLGKTIWSWTQPVRDYASSAWNWLKGKLGLGGSGGGGDGNSEGGVVNWIKEKAQSAWDSIKEVMDPVIKPVQKVAGKIKELIPIKAILNLRKTVQGWLQKVGSMGAAMGDDGSNVADQQVSLREQILPAVLTTIVSVRNKLVDAGLWIGGVIGGLMSQFQGFMSKLRENALLKYAARLLVWIETVISNLGNWAKETVQSLFTWLGDGLVYLSKFIEPVLNTLKQVADTLLNLLGRLPDLILGPLWRAIPKCIRDPLKDFVLNQIFGRLPFFKQLLALKDAWEQIKATALRILKQVFVDGDLFGALWTLFKSILRIFGLPAELVVNIIVKAAQSFGAILSAPIDFLVNILRSMKLGFQNFFSNILTHLLSGAMNWLFGAVSKAGLTPPTDFSIKSIFVFVMDILGLTMELVWRKLAEKIGEEKVEKLKRMIQYASGALEWIKIAINEGPAGLWAKLQEKLSDLWNTLLDGVIGWINEKIIAWASRWLMSLLDVTGIMPVINAMVAVYNAIQSFMENLRAMLEVVNSVLNGIADMAAGAIEPAAKFLEDALVRVIPIVISFLANQAGFGNIAERISEILAKIRCKIEQAVGSVVDSVVDTVRSFVDRIREGVQAVREWWRRRRPFRTRSGETHTLYTEGSPGNLRLMVASRPNAYESFLASVSIAENDPKKTEKVKAKSDAQKLFNELVTLARSNDARGEHEVNTTEFDQKLDKLASCTALLMEGSSGSIPPSTPPVYGGLTAAGYGTSMTVARLSKNGASCQSGTSPPSVPNGVHYAKLNQRRNPDGSGSFYIKGHLLNDNVHGPGNTWKNLTPLTQWANNKGADSHLHAVETFVKQEVCENERIVEYKVQAVYDRTLNQGLIDQLDRGSDPQKAIKKDILREEALIPSKLIADATVVATTKAGDSETVPKKFIASKIVNNSKKIDTSLDQYRVASEAVQVRVLQKLGLNDERSKGGEEAQKALASISGIGPERIDLILNSGGGKFANFEALRQQIEAYAKTKYGDNSRAANAATGLYNLLKDHPKVDLNGTTVWGTE